MRPIAEFPNTRVQDIRYVLTDVDDTLTHHGKLPAKTFLALERLQKAGLRVIPVTAGSSGWCDLIARMWPVDAVIGENGGFYFGRQSNGIAIERRYWTDKAGRDKDGERLRAVLDEIVRLVPGTAPSPDQRYREATLAVTTGDGRLPERLAIDRILAMLGEAGLRATINSMWVLGWAGDFDKLAMTRRLMHERFAIGIEAERDHFLFIGDSPNDEPMFSFFPHSIAVATVRQYVHRMTARPHWITRGPGGDGFVEVVNTLLGPKNRAR